ncbi:hypothetical protein K2173_009925 [Erythroxylum novogranatense]|uniref:HECT-type E3 ubiquitin transferase n=1 Tax=Erythroxylum novogranatense TaxID=1862640 RepID=A0AAV8T112_9ROSI|nr:hypothetical protein K2173_009925 [Erythroxylum novogranatense]
MSIVQSSAVDHNAEAFCGPAKRKLDDYGTDYDDAEIIAAVRMRKEESFSAAVSPPSSSRCWSLVQSSRVSDSKSAATWSTSSSRSGRRVQFFIRLLSEGRHIVVHANKDDTVKSVHERIMAITGIPVIEQRLIYRGRQLQWEQSLAECAIQNDAGLHLVGRLRSTNHPQTCQLVDEMVSFICELCKTRKGLGDCMKRVRDLIDAFFQIATKGENEEPRGHLEVFMASAAPAALVMLYVSPIKGNKECADASIRHFLITCKAAIRKEFYVQCGPIMLELCKLLRKVGGNEDSLYLSCRRTLGSLLEDVEGTLLDDVEESPDLSHLTKGGGRVREDLNGLIAIPEIFPFVSELASSLTEDLVTPVESNMSLGPSSCNVIQFSAFLQPLLAMIMKQLAFRGPICLPLKYSVLNHPQYLHEIEQLHDIFLLMLREMDGCLLNMEETLLSGQNGETNTLRGCDQYLAILKELYSITKLYMSAEEKFWTVLRHRKHSLCVLIVRFARRADDHHWLLQHKDVTNFEARRHLSLMMFPEMKEDYEELHEMLIDRSQLLSESFEYIIRAERESLHSGLFMEFKNEEATGPGVLREWFFLVAQAIFNPENALFVSCPNDLRRFYPNPASKVDPMHLDYFTFSGRVVALALMHRVQLGIVLDRVFFLQLAGKNVCLEDIKDADPCLYSSCKQILGMDAEFIDSDALGLTFIREVEELGCRKVVELCPNGKSIVVNNHNRGEYVNLLIRNRFVTSISQQVSHFTKGFSDILSDPKLRELFFQSLELEDLDGMLRGSDNLISIDDWKSHTEYNGYKESDPLISWFWEIVAEMSSEQRKILLFFWTSIKYLPVEGFRGLGGQLSIYKTSEPHDRLPSSHTCFFRLCFPPYPSIAVMRDRLNFITQEHIGCSFGTW